MIKFIEKAFAKISVLKCIIASVFFISMFVIINGSFIGIEKLLKITNGVNILDFKLWYSPDTAYEILYKLGQLGRTYYIKYIIPLDFIFPASYMLFYVSLILYLLKNLGFSNRHLLKLSLIPVFGALFDYFENIMFITMLIFYPKKISILAEISSMFTTSKFVFNCLSMLVIVILIAVNFLNRHNRKDKKYYKYN